MDEVCVWCGEDVGHEPDCPQIAMDSMQSHIEYLESKLDERQRYIEHITEESKAFKLLHSKAVDERDAALSRLDAVIPALQTIAMQKLRSEFHPDEQDGDYEFAYEVIVKMVRGAVERAGIMVALPSAPVVEPNLWAGTSCE